MAEILLGLSMGLRKDDAGTSNRYLAKIVDREQKINPSLESILQWEIAGITAQKPVLNILRHRVSGKYLDSDEVIGQAVDYAKKERPDVDTFALVTHPFLHRTLYKRLIKKHGFNVRIVKTDWVPFDKESIQWQTRGSFRLFVYTLGRVLFGKKGEETEKLKIKEDGKRMDRDGGKYIVIEKFWRSFFVEVREEKREEKKVLVSPFQIKSPSTGLYREDYRKDSQDIKKAVKAAMKDPHYADQKKNLIKSGVIKAQWRGDKIFALVGLTAILILLIAVLLTIKQSVSVKTEEVLSPSPTAGLSFRLEQGLVGDAEGYQHGIIRQMMAQPEQFGFKGNRTDLQALIDWVGPEAHRIAIRAGYVDFKTGREIRVKYANRVSTVLNVDENGKIVSVSEYERNEDGSFKDVPTQVNYLAPDCNSAQFHGDFQNGVQNYEYIHQSHQPQP